MKNKNLEKIGEKLFIAFIIALTSILCLVMLYISFRWVSNYFTMSDEQICHYSKSILINGQCHSECNTPVSNKRDTLLIGGIAFPIFALLQIFYVYLLLKKFKKINGNKTRVKYGRNM